MKSANISKSICSVRSLRSKKSMASNIGSIKGDTCELLDFGDLLMTAFVKFQCSQTVVVEKEQKRDDYYNVLKQQTPTKRKKLKIMPPQANGPVLQNDFKTINDSKESTVDVTSVDMDTNILTVTTIYDTYNCLIEILLSKLKIPRVLMQIIGCVVPYFQNLSTLTVRQCRIDSYILHEISKILELSSISTLCLDESPVLSQNYTAIINEQSNLQNLSLCRCKIDDDGCKLIAATLHHGATGENLQLLNLSSNHITDIGVKYLSDALRTNRRLRYLNLSDNRITDDGAGHILDVLTEFPLTYDEILNKRLRYVKYLKFRQALYLKYLDDCAIESVDMNQFSKKFTKNKKMARKNRELNTEENAKTRAKMLAFEVLGQFIDTFDLNSIKYHNNYHYCTGNMTLSYLNLSYNNLSFLTVKKIQKVVMYQNVTKKLNQCGLIKVVIDGNNLPMCKVLALLNELLGRNIKMIPGTVGKRKILSRAN